MGITLAMLLSQTLAFTIMRNASVYVVRKKVHYPTHLPGVPLHFQFQLFEQFLRGRVYDLADEEDRSGESLSDGDDERTVYYHVRAGR